MELQCFLAKVTHDLESPARQMNSIVQLLSMSSEFGKDQQLVVDMLRSTARKGILQVDGLGYFAQSINVGNSRLVVNFDDVLLNVAKQYPSLQIKNAIPSHFKIDFNPHALRNILNEILSNALKFAPEGSTPLLSVSIQHAEQLAPLISFKSKSIGVDYGRLENLLSPFSKDAKAKNIDGYGMGLTVVDYLVDQAGGELCLSNSEGYFILDWQLSQMSGHHESKAA